MVAAAAAAYGGSQHVSGLPGAVVESFNKSVGVPSARLCGMTSAPSLGGAWVCCKSFHFSIFRIRCSRYLIFPPDTDIILPPSRRRRAALTQTAPIGALTVFQLYHFTKSHFYTADSQFYSCLIFPGHFSRFNAHQPLTLYHLNNRRGWECDKERRHDALSGFLAN